jgi:DNA-binding transcriptional LysR family regulator
LHLLHFAARVGVKSLRVAVTVKVDTPTESHANMAVSLNTLDLNLLRVFDALMEEQSVLRAGHRVGLSQSAVSHSLARLRAILEDDLFVRTAAGMEPTAKALAMATPVREALIRIELAVASARFDPTGSRRQFTLAAGDYITAVIVPALLQLLKTEAPTVDLIIRPRTRIDLAEQIDLGRIDLAIGDFATVPERFNSNVLFHDEDVLIMSRHSSHGKNGITLSDLSKMPFMVVSLGGEEEGALHGFISERGLARRSELFDRSALVTALAELKVTPRIVLAQPHFLALPSLLADSDAVAIVPRLLATLFANSGAVVVHDLPYRRRVAVRTVWHKRNERDAGNAWLRGLLDRAVAKVTSPGRQG